MSAAKRELRAQHRYERVRDPKVKQTTRCFWTWPFGHVWSGLTGEYLDDGYSMRCLNCGKGWSANDW